MAIFWENWRMKLWYLYYSPDTINKYFFIPIKLENEEVTMYRSDGGQGFLWMEGVKYFPNQWPDDEIVDSGETAYIAIKALFTHGLGVL